MSEVESENLAPPAQSIVSGQASGPAQELLIDPTQEYSSGPTQESSNGQAQESSDSNAELESDWQLFDVSKNLIPEALELIESDQTQNLTSAPNRTESAQTDSAQAETGEANSTQAQAIDSRWLGQVDYVQTHLEVSNQFKAQTQEECIDGLEHPITITLGRRADPLKDVKAPLKVLRERNIQIVGTERGGQATLHNQGQLVIYPYIHLPTRQLRVRDYLALLEATTKEMLSQYGISAYAKGDEPGLYSVKGKIAFFGVRIQKGWSSHGVAINVRNDLADFNLIRSCGREQEAFSRMQDFGVTAPLSLIFQQWCEIFRRNLDPAP